MRSKGRRPLTVDEWLLAGDLGSDAIPNRAEFAFLLEWLKSARKTPPVLFVGAGLSLNAAPARGADPSTRMRTWTELVEGLAQALGADPVGANSLEIAERYEKTFGRKKLWDHVRDAVPDNAMRPGKVHRAVAEFDWHAVLTLNYDTLLERAYEQRGIPAFVLTADPHWSAMYERDHIARVAHLHGHIHQSPKDLVLTAEDFRRYPDKRPVTHAAVRQLLLQHPTLFLGVSADDPNLYQWAGWIRDHLGTVKAPWLRLDAVVNDGDGPRERPLGFDAMWKDSFQTVTVACAERALIDSTLARVVNALHFQLAKGSTRVAKYISAHAERKRISITGGGNPTANLAGQKLPRVGARELLDDVESALIDNLESPPAASASYEAQRILTAVLEHFLDESLTTSKQRAAIDAPAQHEVEIARSLNRNRSDGASLKTQPEEQQSTTDEECVRAWLEILGTTFTRIAWLAARLRLNSIHLPRNSRHGSRRIPIMSVVDVVRATCERAQWLPLVEQTLDLSLAGVPREKRKEAALERLDRKGNELPEFVHDIFHHLDFLDGRALAGPRPTQLFAQTQRRGGFLAALDGDWKRAKEFYSRAYRLSQQQGESRSLQLLTFGSAEDAGQLEESARFGKVQTEADEQGDADAKDQHPGIEDEQRLRDRFQNAVSGYLDGSSQRLRQALDAEVRGDRYRFSFHVGSDTVGASLRYLERYWLFPERAKLFARLEGDALWDAGEFTKAVQTYARYGHEKIVSDRVETLVDTKRDFLLPTELFASIEVPGRYAAEEHAKIEALSAAVSEWTADGKQMAARLAAAAGILRDKQARFTSRNYLPLEPIAGWVASATRFLSFKEFALIWSENANDLRKAFADNDLRKRWPLPVIAWWREASDPIRQGRKIETILAKVFDGGLTKSPWLREQLFERLLAEAESSPKRIDILRRSFPRAFSMLDAWLRSAPDTADEGNYWLWAACKNVFDPGSLRRKDIDSRAARWFKQVLDEPRRTYGVFDFSAPVRAWLAYLTKPPSGTLKLANRWLDLAWPTLKKQADKATVDRAGRKPDLFGRVLSRALQAETRRAARERLTAIASAYLAFFPSAARLFMTLTTGAVVQKATSIVDDLFAGKHGFLETEADAQMAALGALEERTSANRIPIPWLYAAARLTSARNESVAMRAAFAIAHCLEVVKKGALRDYLVTALTATIGDARASVASTAIRAFGVSWPSLTIQERRRAKEAIADVSNDRRLALRFAFREVAPIVSEPSLGGKTH